MKTAEILARPAKRFTVATALVEAGYTLNNAGDYQGTMSAGDRRHQGVAETQN
jgi:hypothetical protein